MNNHTPKISVLMPIYKTNEQYLKEAIESVLSQSFTNFEFLILDDCPNDDRENIVKFYKDERIKYSKNEHNLGITPSRNKLIDMASGEYLAIFDHDDISLPNRFLEQVKYLDEHPNVGVVSSWIEKFPNEKILEFPTSDAEIKTLLMGDCVLTHSASMIRKSILTEHQLKYEEEFSPAEDYALWLRLIEYTQFYNIPKVLFKYRLHENNTTFNQLDKMLNASSKLKVWAKNKYPVLYNSYIRDRNKEITIKLFKIIPLLKIRSKANTLKLYLFNFIPILFVKKRIISWPK